MTKCPRCKAKVVEREFDYDLNCFDIYKEQDEYVGSILPDSIDDMKGIKKALKNGECPLCDNWEDGLGRTLGHGVE